MSFSRTFGAGVPPEEFRHHALAVASNLERLGMPHAVAMVLGVYHDIGKATEQWQSYLLSSCRDNRFVEHKAHGAKMLAEDPAINGKNSVLSRAIYSHHGRGDVTGLQQSAMGEYEYREEVGWFADGSGKLAPVAPPPLKDEEERLLREAQGLVPALPEKYLERPKDRFSAANDFRLATARLVWSDWDAAGGVESKPPVAVPGLMEKLLESIETKYDSFGEPLTPVDKVRNEIRMALEGKAGVPPGRVYSLSVPTGGGKTLSSMDWAIRHAIKHGKRRIIVVVPYIRVIRQNASVMREVFGEGHVVEAHSLAPLKKSQRTGDHGWGGDIVVTTDVAFFLSWYTKDTRNLLRSLDMVNSVIIFDEVQWIPTTHILPCTGFMKYLADEMDSTILLTTATMPDYSHKDALGAVSMVEPVPLFPDSVAAGWYESLRRVECRFIGSMTIGTSVSHFVQNHPASSALFIVNSTAHARELYSSLLPWCGEGEVFHLSRRMTQGDIERVLDEVTIRLASGKRTVLVATPLVEAGVDISFPVVYRSQCGLDSLAQSAGRCNRHGELPQPGKLYLYKRDDTEGRDELENPFWNTLNRGFRCLCKVFERETADGAPIDIYDGERMQRYFRMFFTRCQERDKERLTRGYEACARNIDLIGDTGACRILVVTPSMESAVSAMLERERREEEGFRFTPGERELIALNTVSLHIPKETREEMERTVPFMEGSELWVFYTSNEDAPLHYDSVLGLDTE